MVATIKELRFRALMFLVVVTILSVLFADAIKTAFLAAVKWLWNLIRAVNLFLATQVANAAQNVVDNISEAENVESDPEPVEKPVRSRKSSRKS